MTLVRTRPTQYNQAYHVSTSFPFMPIFETKSDLHLWNLMIFNEFSFKKNKKIYNVHVVKFIYSEKATKFCEIFPLLLTVCTVVKSKGKISQNFVAFSEYLNFKLCLHIPKYILLYVLSNIQVFESIKKKGQACKELDMRSDFFQLGCFGFHVSFWLILNFLA